MKKILLLGSLLFFVVVGVQPLALAADKIRVVATMSTLGEFTQKIMGAEADIHVVAKPGRNIHFIQPTPKDVLKVKKADVLIHSGLDLEAWRQPLLNAAGNSRFLGTSEDAIDASQGIQLLEIPTSVSRIEGDIHVFGNPHYWTDPENAKQMVRNIADGLGRIYPESAARYQANAEVLIARIDQSEMKWKSALAPYRGMTLVTYHRSWPYFAERFGFKIVGYIEPKPGTPPTAKHLQELTELMKTNKVRLVIKEIYNEKRAAEKVAHDAGVPLVTLLQFAGEDKTAGYIEMMDENVKRIVSALSGGTLS